MKSIQTKFLILILSSVILCAAVIGIISIRSSSRIIEEDSAMSMNLMCEERAAALNSLLMHIEQSVDTLADYAISELESADRLIEDRAYRSVYTEKMRNVSLNAAINTDGALAVYLHFNPETMPPAEGFFMNKESRYGELVETAPTDLSLYPHGDRENAGWYYIPVFRKHATWLEPYLHQDLNELMISYVIPLYKDRQLIGVIGMDIEFNALKDLIKDAEIYDTGYAFLVNQHGDVMYHPVFDMRVNMTQISEDLSPVISELKKISSSGALFSYRWNESDKKMAFCALRNGMRLAITAPVVEIDADRHSLFAIILAVTVIIALIFGCITLFFAEKLIRPLKELTAAAQKISGGDLDVSLTSKTDDEIGILTESFRNTAASLKHYMDYMNNLAYSDVLTGTRNKTAYHEAVARLNESIEKGYADFAVAIFDINNLKLINDTLGHDAGDMLIVRACHHISSVFEGSPVYRIGGDEFVVIFEGNPGDFTHPDKSFDSRIHADLNGESDEIMLSMAHGTAVYDRSIDSSYGDVFRRADQAMYADKTRMKKADRDLPEEAF